MKNEGHQVHIFRNQWHRSVAYTPLVAILFCGLFAAVSFLLSYHFLTEGTGEEGGAVLTMLTIASTSVTSACRGLPVS